MRLNRVFSLMYPSKSSLEAACLFHNDVTWFLRGLKLFVYQNKLDATERSLCVSLTANLVSAADDKINIHIEKYKVSSQKEIRVISVDPILQKLITSRKSLKY